jgi:plasmid replication initiation protein
MLKDKKEVIKHSSAIHIENKATLLQRRAWNVMLANAYDDLPTEDEYIVSVSDLNQVLGYDSRNDKHLKESLKALVACLVEWDVLDKDGSPEWGATALLGSVEIKKGVCTYGYSPALRKRLHSPKMYARINLSLQNKFDSKHALALYELCVDYLDMKRNCGETPWIEISRFRKLMGIAESMYTDFKRLNRDVIRKSVTEVNRVTDFNVTIEYKRQGRKVVAVKFIIHRILQIPEQNPAHAEPLVDTEGLPELVAELVKAGVHHNKAMKIWSQGFKNVTDKPKDVAFADYVREKIDLLQMETAKGRVEDKGAWLVAAIRDNYTHPTYQKRKRQNEIREQIAALESRKGRLKLEQGRREVQILEPLLADEAEIEKAFELCKQDSLFQERCGKYTDNPREGLEDDDFFAAGIRLAIKAEHIDKFTELDSYQQRIDKAESQIMQLKAQLRN